MQPEVEWVGDAVTGFKVAVHLHVDEEPAVCFTTRVEDVDGGCVVNQRFLRPGLYAVAAVVLAELIDQEDVDGDGGCDGLCVEGLYAPEKLLDWVCHVGRLAGFRYSVLAVSSSCLVVGQLGDENGNPMTTGTLFRLLRGFVAPSTLSIIFHDRGRPSYER